jgi:hypothetical protein
MKGPSMKRNWFRPWGDIKLACQGEVQASSRNQRRYWQKLERKAAHRKVREVPNHDQ